MPFQFVTLKLQIALFFFLSNMNSQFDQFYEFCPDAQVH